MSDAGEAPRPEWWEIDDWFDYKDYDGFSGLDDAGWVRVLRAIHVTSAAPDRIGIELWWGLRAQGWREAREPNEDEDDCESFLDDRPLVDLAEIEAEEGAIRRIGRGVRAPRNHPVIQIDLRTPDAVLVDAFKVWLAGQRRGRGGPLPVVQRAPDRWARYRIAAVFDLDFWAFLRNSDPDPANHVDADRSQGKLPTKFIAERVFPDLPPSYTDAERARHVSEARSALREALFLCPIVALQANSEIR